MKLTTQQPDVREIRVKLLLAGGQSAMLVVPPQHPLLGQLLGTVAAGDGVTRDGRPPMFQIPMEGGRASLAFSARQLVGVVTDPAVVVENDTPVPEAEESMISPAVAAAGSAGASHGHGNLIRHPVVQLDKFLTPAEVTWLMELTFAAENRFVRSRLSNARDDYRHSLMLAAPHELWESMTGKIRAVMPEVMPRLDVGAFPIGNIDCQVTASIDGSYFKVHNDSGSNETYKRQFTYVYYFNREPKGFEGGELRIYDDTIRGGKLVAADSFQVIEPRHNSIVFFRAAVMHEVMPVSVASKQFRDARLTVNGWIARQ